MAQYSYTIFDANPNTSSGTAWPSHTDIEIEADSDDEAADEVRDVMSIEAAGLSVSDGYEVGDRLYAIIWDADTVIVSEPTYELTAEDLGVVEATDLPDDAVIVETMPDQHRDSHRAAGNWGRYPGIGSERRIMSREAAEEIVEADEDGYDRIVRDADAEDATNYEVVA